MTNELIAQAEALEHQAQEASEIGQSKLTGNEIAILLRDRAAELRAQAAEQPAEQAVARYLCDATRFKMSFDDEGNVACFGNFAHVLDGRWVALVAAENDAHMKPAPQVAELRALLVDTKETLQKLKLRIHFIGWPAEPKREDGCVDWREEIAALEGSLKRIEAALKEE